MTIKQVVFTTTFLAVLLGIAFEAVSLIVGPIQ